MGATLNVRIDDETVKKLEEKMETSGVDNMSVHVRLAVKQYVADMPSDMQLADETLLALQWAGAELSSLHGRPLMTLDSIVKALVAHWDQTKLVQGGEKLNTLGRLPSGVVQLGYS